MTKTNPLKARRPVIPAEDRAASRLGWLLGVPFVIGVLASLTIIFILIGLPVVLLAVLTYVALQNRRLGAHRWWSNFLVALVTLAAVVGLCLTTYWMIQHHSGIEAAGYLAYCVPLVWTIAWVIQAVRLVRSRAGS